MIAPVTSQRLTLRGTLTQGTSSSRTLGVGTLHSRCWGFYAAGYSTRWR